MTLNRLIFIKLVQAHLSPLPLYMVPHLQSPSRLALYYTRNMLLISQAVTVSTTFLAFYCTSIQHSSFLHFYLFHQLLFVSHKGRLFLEHILLIKQYLQVFLSTIPLTTFGSRSMVSVTIAKPLHKGEFGDLPLLVVYSCLPVDCLLTYVYHS